ncbi:hypothetical protein SFRURICE_008945 [Spodoptera frugiperda]|nr:hypothetical protein SFRURICE_008945 [Spodoptera frugiperda]
MGLLTNRIELLLVVNTQRHAFHTALHITALNAVKQCTPTFHHLCYKSHVIGGEPIATYTGHNSRLRATTEKIF